MAPPYQVNATYNIPEELVAMLEADMTVGQAVAEHRKNWGFRTHQGLQHELAHLILGLAGIPKYQKNMGIEIYVVAIETHLGAGLDKSNWLGLSNGKKTLQNRWLQAKQVA